MSVLAEVPGNFALAHSNELLETLIAAERFGDDRLRKVIGHFVTRAHPLLQGGWEHDQSHVGTKAREQIEIALADPNRLTGREN